MNFPLLHRLFVQIGRILKINGLTVITDDVVSASPGQPKRQSAPAARQSACLSRMLAWSHRQTGGKHLLLQFAGAVGFAGHQLACFAAASRW
jgi:hypothetical protein